MNCQSSFLAYLQVCAEQCSYQYSNDHPWTGEGAYSNTHPGHELQNIDSGNHLWMNGDILNIVS